MRLIFLIFIILIFSGCEKKEDINQNIVSTTTKSSNLSLKDVFGRSYEFEKKGNGFNFGKLSGKIVLLDFFATWCPPCKAEIPHLINIQKEYGDKFKIVGVLMEEDKPVDEIKEFIDEYKINYIVLNSGDISKLVKSVGGVRSIPFMIMYDESGEYFTHYIGAVPEEMIISDIKRAIKEW